MANSSIQKQMMVKTKTITGTTDNNGFINLNMKVGEAVIVGSTDLYIDNQPSYAFFMNVLYRGGTPAEYLSVQFETWEHNITAKNKNVSVTINYIEL